MKRMFTKTQIQEIVDNAIANKVNAYRGNNLTDFMNKLKLGDMVEVSGGDFYIVINADIHEPRQEDDYLLLLRVNTSPTLETIGFYFDGQLWQEDETINFLESGTKLYNHHIVFTTGDELNIISNVPNVATSYAQIQSLFISMYIARATSANYGSGSVMEMYMNSDDFEIKYYDTDEGVRSISLQAHDIDEDTVTPL